jgi:trypsin
MILAILNSSKTFDGELAEESAFPFFVRIDLLNAGLFVPSCGGALLDATTVLTAAHCIHDNDAQRFRVRAGRMVSD